MDRQYHLFKVIPVLCLVIFLMLYSKTRFVDEINPVRKSTDQVWAQSEPRMCTRTERLDRIRHWCKIQKNVRGKPFEDVRYLPHEQLKRVVGHLLVDDRHKVLYCDIAKAGSTSWKHILANNTGIYRPIPNGAIHVLFNNDNKYNITWLFKQSRTDILKKLSTYYKFLVVRHPLDRIVSAYRDKLANHNPVFEKGLGSRILHELRPNATREEVKLGQGVTFEEYVAFISAFHMNDQHFENYQDHCQPCLINYDYVAKLETMETDGRYIINERLSGYGADSLVNKHSNRGGATTSKRLREFEEISDRLAHDVTAVYARDIDMFGYSVQRVDDSVLATCGDVHTDECC